MNINWAAIANEMRVLGFVRDYLELHDHPELAVVIAAKLNECGSLTQAMRSVILAAKEIAEKDQDDEDNEDEDEDEEGDDVE